MAQLEGGTPRDWIPRIPPLVSAIWFADFQAQLCSSQRLCLDQG